MEIRSPTSHADSIDRILVLESAILEAYYTQSATTDLIRESALAAGFTDEEVAAALADLDRNRYMALKPDFPGHG